MDGPSNQYILNFLKNFKDAEESQSSNVSTTKRDVTRTNPIPNFLINTNHSTNKKSDVSKVNVSSSTTSIYTSEENPKNVTQQNALIDEFCILNSTFTPSKNVAKPATRTHVTACFNKQVEKELHSKTIQTKSMLQRNISTQIEPVIIKPSSYGVKLKEVSRAEKTTYCRPVVNRYTQEFVQQTMEKNARLQDLIRRLATARQAEKQNDSWNNFINELKNKHTHYDPGTSNVGTLITHNETVKLIADYNKIKLNANLFEHYYNDNIVYSDSDAQNQVIIKNSPRYNSTYKYGNNSYCYPTSSQARLSMLGQDRRGSQLSDQRQSIRPIDKRVNGSIVLDTRLWKISDGNLGKFCKCDERLSLKSNKVQTEPVNIKKLNNPISSNDNTVLDNSEKEFDVAVRKLKDIKLSNDVDKIRGRVSRDSRSHSKQTSLATIEYKVDTLIKSINTFITEIKAKNAYDLCHKSVAVSISIENIHKIQTNNNKNDETDAKAGVTSRIDAFGSPRREEIICGMTTANSVYSGSPKSSNIDEILIEERNKSDKVKKDIENILTKNDNHCAVQITLDIPTKEGATEVTESFYDTLDTIEEELDSRSTRRVTIAVNTDPMGLLALLRVSTEALKQILSYVPNIDYLAYYLARLQQAPGIKPAHEMQPSFECNICGAAFRKPLHLSDHIHQHKLGSSRNCCVCRHEINATHHRSALFRCQHCGQLFTRAYCRQLHEQTCVKNTSKNRNTTPAGLLLLS